MFKFHDSQGWDSMEFKYHVRSHGVTPITGQLPPRDLKTSSIRFAEPQHHPVTADNRYSIVLPIDNQRAGKLSTVMTQQPCLR